MSTRQKSGAPAYVMILVGFFILVISVLALIQAVGFYSTGQTLTALYYAVLAAVGISLSVSSIRQFNRMKMLKTLPARVLSTVACSGCGFKIVRPFATGDFVSKSVGRCQQCAGAMRITAIYANSPETPPQRLSGF